MADGWGASQNEPVLAIEQAGVNDDLSVVEKKALNRLMDRSNASLVVVVVIDAVVACFKRQLVYYL